MFVDENIVRKTIKKSKEMIITKTDISVRRKRKFMMGFCDAYNILLSDRFIIIC